VSTSHIKNMGKIHMRLLSSTNRKCSKMRMLKGGSVFSFVSLVRCRAVLLSHTLPDFHADSFAQWRGDCITNLRNGKGQQDCTCIERKRFKELVRVNGKRKAGKLTERKSVAAYLAVSIQNTSEESIRIRETLRSGAFSHTHDSRLLRMQHASLKTRMSSCETSQRRRW